MTIGFEREEIKDEETGIKKIIYKTDKGIDFIIDRRPSGYFFIGLAKGGTVPKQLEGIWTSIGFASRALEGYLSSVKNIETEKEEVKEEKTKVEDAFAVLEEVKEEKPKQETKKKADK